MKAFYDNKPTAFEAVGNGNYLYRWDIKEEEVQHGEHNTKCYVCNEVTVHGKPEYGKCVEAVIRDSYTNEAELSLINQYNAYQQGVSDDSSVVGEYEEYLAFVASVKVMVKKDIGIEAVEVNRPAVARLADVARLLTLTVNTMNLTDDEAFRVKSLYPDFTECIGKQLPAGFRLQDGGKLYKVIQAHTAQADWKPSETPALYGLVTESHAGTLKDPIPYERMMILEQGKYYTQYGVTYKCVTDSIVGYDADLTDLLALLEKV